MFSKFLFPDPFCQISMYFLQVLPNGNPLWANRLTFPASDTALRALPLLNVLPLPFNHIVIWVNMILVPHLKAARYIHTRRTWHTITAARAASAGPQGYVWHLPHCLPATWEALQQGSNCPCRPYSKSCAVCPCHRPRYSRSNESSDSTHILHLPARKPVLPPLHPSEPSRWGILR